MPRITPVRWQLLIQGSLNAGMSTCRSQDNLCETYLTGKSFLPCSSSTCIFSAACLTPQELPTKVSNLRMGVVSASLPLIQVNCLPQKTKMHFATSLIFLMTHEEVTVGTLKLMLAFGLLTNPSSKSFVVGINRRLLALCALTSLTGLRSQQKCLGGGVDCECRGSGLYTQTVLVELLR